MRSQAWPYLGVTMLLGAASAGGASPEDGLIAHWPLLADSRDTSGHGHHGAAQGVGFDGAEGAVFDGQTSCIEVPASAGLELGRDTFTIAVWVHTASDLTDVLGDLLSKYDPSTRTGLNLGLMNTVGATTAQPNRRQLFFGLDAGSPGVRWDDCGRPGNNRMIWALTVFDGALYAGTWEPGAGEAGHVYRYAGGQDWVDCGSPDASNAVSSLAVYGGRLYAGTSFYSGRGSALPESPNKNPGGKVYRYAGDKRWEDCGNLSKVWTVTGLVDFGGTLYATTCDSYGCPNAAQACYRYEGGTTWSFAGNPGGRLGAFAVHNGSLHATVFGKEGFARYEGGTDWTPLGVLPGVGQTYSSVIHRGRICLGTWPNGEVFRYDGPRTFTSLGRLGSEKEVMAMAVYNGMLYAGTLPLGEVYRYDGGEAGWTRLAQLDRTPDVTYRRVWSMAVFRGRLFAGTLPSGHVFSLEAGACVTHDRALAPGWRHVTAVRGKEQLALYVDGNLVAESRPLGADSLDLTNGQPLRIGVGEHDFLNGRLRDLRLYGRALAQAEIAVLASGE